MSKSANAKLMKKMGFSTDPYEIKLGFPSKVSYWTNKRGIKVITHNEEKITIEKVVDQIIASSFRACKEKIFKQMYNINENQ